MSCNSWLVVARTRLTFRIWRITQLTMATLKMTATLRNFGTTWSHYQINKRKSSFYSSQDQIAHLSLVSNIWTLKWWLQEIMQKMEIPKIDSLPQQHVWVCCDCLNTEPKMTWRERSTTLSTPIKVSSWVDHFKNNGIFYKYKYQ